MTDHTLPPPMSPREARQVRANLAGGVRDLFDRATVARADARIDAAHEIARITGMDADDVHDAICAYSPPSAWPLVAGLIATFAVTVAVSLLR